MACLDVIEPRRHRWRRWGDGGGGAVAAGQRCTDCRAGHQRVPGLLVPAADARPFISLARLRAGRSQLDRLPRFRSAADAAVAGNPPYAYSATHSVIMYRITGKTRVHRRRHRPRRAVRRGGRSGHRRAAGAPAIAGDSYLEVGLVSSSSWR